jgi:hypothetical protein
MSEIEEEIDSVVAALGVDLGGWLKLSPAQAHEVYHAAKDRFVEGDPRSWWLALKQPADCHEVPKGDGCMVVHTLVPPSNERCWFIPETEEAELLVYDILVADLSHVLGDCQFLEYYLVGKNLDWLVVENDHNEVLVVKAGASDDTR